MESRPSTRRRARKKADRTPVSVWEVRRAQLLARHRMITGQD